MPLRYHLHYDQRVMKPRALLISLFIIGFFFPRLLEIDGLDCNIAGLAAGFVNSMSKIWGPFKFAIYSKPGQNREPLCAPLAAVE